MSGHPEVDPSIQELTDFVLSQDVCDVWCKGCGDWRKMNNQYAKYVRGEIESCGKCRQ